MTYEASLTGRANMQQQNSLGGRINLADLDYFFESIAASLNSKTFSKLLSEILFDIFI